jgi:hypothetical protein
MIVGIIVIGIILSFLIAFSLYAHATDKCNFGDGFVCGMFVIILLIVEIILICDISNEVKPKAIDVYRGNTELQIHSINNIPQDTVVVWKGNKQK